MEKKIGSKHIDLKRIEQHMRHTQGMYKLCDQSLVSLAFTVNFAAGFVAVLNYLQEVIRPKSKHDAKRDECGRNVARLPAAENQTQILITLTFIT